MHDKVKELALVAQLGPVMLLNYYGTVDALTDSEQEDFQKLERFAELIVKECVHIAYNKMAIQKKDGIRPSVVCDAIKEHFGVEE